MSAKRPATFTIDEKTLEDVDNNNQAPRLEDKLPSQRTIFSVKKDEKEVDNNEKSQEKVQDKQPEEKAVAGKQEEKKEQKGLMFANLFKNNTNGVGIFSGSGLFGNINLTSKVEPPKINYSSSNLFTGNGFSTAPAPAPLTGSLFSNINSNSIFGFGSGTSVPPVKNNGGEEQQGDSAELQQGQELKTDRSKSSGNYKYEEEIKVLANGHVKKYKKNNGDLVENVDAILQYDEKAKIHVLVIRLSATKNSIFTGLVLHGKSEARNINGKDENIEVSAFVVKKGKPAEKDRLKLQFETAEEGKAFLAKIQGVIKTQSAKSE